MVSFEINCFEDFFWGGEGGKQTRENIKYFSSRNIMIRIIIHMMWMCRWMIRMVHQSAWYLCDCATRLSCVAWVTNLGLGGIWLSYKWDWAVLLWLSLSDVWLLLLNGIDLYYLDCHVKVWMVYGSPENQCKITLTHKGILYYITVNLMIDKFHLTNFSGHERLWDHYDTFEL